MPRDKRFSRDDILRAIHDWLLRSGLPPTIEELRGALGVGSTRTVLRYLAWLEEKGDIERWHGARGIRLLRAPEAGVETQAVPLVGEVPAGPVMLAEQNINGWVRVPKDRVRGGTYVLLRVVGDSMNQARVRDGHTIEDGDLVLVRQQATAEPGDLVVALIDGEATVKRFEPQRGYIVLRPQSSAPHDPIIVDEDFRLQGVVRGVLKKGSTVI